MTHDKKITRQTRMFLYRSNHSRLSRKRRRMQDNETRKRGEQTTMQDKCDKIDKTIVTRNIVLGHRSRRLQWPIVIKRRPLSVRPSSDHYKVLCPVFKEWNTIYQCQLIENLMPFQTNITRKGYPYGKCNDGTEYSSRYGTRYNRMVSISHFVFNF